MKSVNCSPISFQKMEWLERLLKNLKLRGWKETHEFLKMLQEKIRSGLLYGLHCFTVVSVSWMVWWVRIEGSLKKLQMQESRISGQEFSFGLLCVLGLLGNSRSVCFILSF